MRKGKPNDPERRSKILRAALEVIAKDGVPGASFRRIAVQANVPLGSTTYYFSDLETLIVSAFEKLGAELEPRYGKPIREAQNKNDVVDALVEATCGRTAPTEQDLRLFEEMRRYGLHSSLVGALLRELQEESLVILGMALSDGAARAVDALMSGWWSSQVLHPDIPLDPATVKSSYKALTQIGATDFGSLEDQSAPNEAPRRGA